MRTIEEQLSQILRSGIATVKTDDGFGENWINVPAVARFFPAIHPNRLQAAWSAKSASGESLPAYERITQYLESAREESMTAPGLVSSEPEQATIVRAPVMIVPAHGGTETQSQTDRPVTITISSDPEDKPSTLTMALRPSLIPQIRIGDVIRLARDQEKPNTRLALVLEVDQLSSTTLMVSVWWYRTAHNFFADIEATVPPSAWPESPAEA